MLNVQDFIPISSIKDPQKVRLLIYTSDEKVAHVPLLSIFDSIADYKAKQNLPNENSQ